MRFVCCSSQLEISHASSERSLWSLEFLFAETHKWFSHSSDSVTVYVTGLYPTKLFAVDAHDLVFTFCAV